MSLNLSSDEKVLQKAKIHWISILPQSFIFLMGVMIITAHLLGGSDKGNPIPIGVFLMVPLLWKSLSNYVKDYRITTKKVYLGSGILARNVSETMIHKINDIQVKQSLSQRMFGAGNIIFSTGNDTSFTIKDISKPFDFKNTVNGVIEDKDKAA